MTRTMPPTTPVDATTFSAVAKKTSPRLSFGMGIESKRQHVLLKSGMRRRIEPSISMNSVRAACSARSFGHPQALTMYRWAGMVRKKSANARNASCPGDTCPVRGEFSSVGFLFIGCGSLTSPPLEGARLEAPWAESLVAHDSLDDVRGHVDEAVVDRNHRCGRIRRGVRHLESVGPDYRRSRTAVSPARDARDLLG